MLKFATKIAPETPLFQQAVDAGFQYVELWLGDHLLDEVDQILEMASQHALGIVAHFPNRGDLTETRLQETVRLYQGLKSEAMVIHPPMLKQCGARLRELHPTIRLAVENGALDLEGFWQWAEESPGLNLDVEHLWLYSLEGNPIEVWVETLERFLEAYHDKLYHVHMPGCKPGQAEHRPAYLNPRMACELWWLLDQYQFGGLAVSELNLEWQVPEHLERDVALFRRWCEDPKGTLELARKDPEALLPLPAIGH